MAASTCAAVRWFYPSKPFPELLMQHLGNFAHTPLSEKALVLLEQGRIVRVIDLDEVDGRSQPHRLSGIVEHAFKPKRAKAVMGRGFSGDPFVLLGVNETASDDVISKRYKQLVKEYHPDQVAHLGQELKELAAKKTTEINAAFAAIRKVRKV
jgi:DnaJ domain